MSRRVAKVHRVTRTVGIAIDSTFAEGAQAISRMETQQAWVVGAISTAQYVAPRLLVLGFSVESQRACEVAFRFAVPVRAVRLCALKCAALDALVWFEPFHGERPSSLPDVIQTI